MQQALSELKECKDDSLRKFIDMFQYDRLIVEVSKVKELINGNCQVSDCELQRIMTEHTFEGGVMTAKYSCSNGHSDVELILLLGVEEQPKTLCYNNGNECRC